MSTPKEDALRYALMAGLAGVTVGGGLAYLANMQNIDPDADEFTPNSPDLVNIPIPAKVKKNNQNLLMDKSAGDTGLGSSEFWAGNHAKNWYEVPWLPAAAVGLPVIGGAISHGITSSLLKSKRKEEREEEIADAEEAYNKALLDSYTPKKLTLGKMATAVEIGSGLNKLASLLKIAQSGGTPTWVDVPIPNGPPVSSTLGSTNSSKDEGLLKWLHSFVPKEIADRARGLTAGAAGALALLGLTIPAAGAYTAYNYYRSRDKTKLLNDAAKKRQIQRMDRNMPEPFVQIEE